VVAVAGIYGVRFGSSPRWAFLVIRFMMLGERKNIPNASRVTPAYQTFFSLVVSSLTTRNASSGFSGS